MATIITKNSSTPSSVPTAGDLVQGELAVNVADKRLFTEDSTGSVVELGINPTSITTGAITASGTVTANSSLVSSNVTITGGSINGSMSVGGTWTAAATWTLPAFTLNGTVTANGQSFSGTIADLGTVTTVDIDGGTLDNVTIGGSTAAAGSFTTLSASGNITVSGTVDGRDIATDGAKLDNIEANADVTDETNVLAALDGASITTAAPTTSDKVLFQDVTNSDNLRQATINDVLLLAPPVQVVDALNGASISTATVAGTDKVLIQDTDDSDNLKTVTAQSIADLAPTDPTLATQTKTYISGEASTLTLSSAVTAGTPVVSVTKEVPQTGVSNNNWDVNSTAENYTRTDSALATTLTPSATGDGTFTLGAGSFTSDDVGKTIEGNGGVAILTSTGGAYVTTTDFTDTSAIASGEWSMYAVVYNSTDGDLELSGIAENLFDISAASFVDAFDVSAQETVPTGIAFNTDGTKMFIVGEDGDDVNEYDLTTGFDVSTATYSQNFSVSAQETFPRDVAFNTDGTKMFIVGSDGDEVNEYDLATGFDVSTATYSQNFSVSSQETVPTGIAFNTDGTKMFIVGSDGDEVNEYDLATGFDVSTASYSQNFSVSAQDTAPAGIAFNTDGTKMFIVGFSGDDVNEYDLATGFDVSTASFVDTFSVSAQDTSPHGIAFNTDGSKMFIVGIDGDDVNEYDVGSFFIPSGYQAAHTTVSTDTTYWTDVNSMTVDEAAGSGTVNYALSTDDRTTWTVIDNTDGVRDIVRNNGGTWQYNSNATYGSETWTDATTNTELSALEEAMATAQNRMDKTQLEAVADANHITLANDLDLAIIFNLSSGETVPSSDGVSINYDANTLNEGAVLGTDYDWDFPATDKVRITALTSGNFEVRVV